MTTTNQIAPLCDAACDCAPCRTRRWVAECTLARNNRFAEEEEFWRALMERSGDDIGVNLRGASLEVVQTFATLVLLQMWSPGFPDCDYHIWVAGALEAARDVVSDLETVAS